MADPREGIPLVSKNRVLPFSFFPVGKGSRRFGIFEVQFASSPWAVMRAVVDRSLEGDSLKEALAFLEQGQDFYEAAQGRPSTNPLLHYYAMLNVAKAVLRVRSGIGKLETAHHGLQDRSANAVQPNQVDIAVKGPSQDNPRIFGELLAALGYGYPPIGALWKASDLMPQVVVGHRLWREATGEGERFVPIDDLNFMENKEKKQIWLEIRISKETLRRHGITQKRLFAEGGLKPGFQRVRDRIDSDGYLCFEQVEPVNYSHRATENVMDVVKVSRPLLWRIVSSIPGGSYRKYYLYLSPSGTLRVSQLASMWALLFYLGSVVRYRPHRFVDVITSPYGPFVDEFISAQPNQMLYMFASEMSRHEIANPAIV
jgi:YaaC-like Protein